MRKFIFGLGILMFWGFSILLILIEIIGINEVGWAVTAAKIAIVFLLTVAIHRIWRSIFNRKRNLNRDGGRSNAPSMFKHMVAGAVAGYVASAVSSKAHKKNSNSQFRTLRLAPPVGVTVLISKAHTKRRWRRRIN